jgi:16S rRNA processing protein RimM
MKKDYLIVGRVVKPFGVRGEVNVKPITDRVERFNDLPYVYIKKGEDFEKIDIERARPHGEHVCLKPAEFTTRDEAAGLTGEMLYVDREHAAPIDAGSHYHYDLVGCAVRTSDGRNLGTLREILNAGSCDVYVVVSDEHQGKGKETLIPAISEVVKKIDVTAKEIVIEPLEGLL